MSPMERQQHPAAHPEEWVQARYSAWDNACMEFGPDSHEAKKARKRYYQGLAHYSRQTRVPIHHLHDFTVPTIGATEAPPPALDSLTALGLTPSDDPSRR
jgi:hypothetical protein